MENTYKISDIIDSYISGDWGNNSKTAKTPYPVYCVRGADIVPISNSQYNDIPLRYVSMHSFKTLCLQEGDIIIEKSGGSPTQSTGRVVYVSKELLAQKNNIVCSNFCTAFRVKKGWNAHYVFLYLQNVYNSGIFFNFEGKTSGLKNLMMDAAFNSIPIKRITMAEQTAITASISVIEKKLSLNRQINDNLEAMAKHLYDYWFVQFDFPDENGKPYKSSGGAMVWNEKLKHEIPKGWSDCILGDICDMYQPKTLGLNDLSEDSEYKVYGANGIIGHYSSYNHENSEIAMACRGNSCGTINRTSPKSWITGNAMVIKFRNKEIHNEYIKQALKYANVKGAISGSGQPQLTRENLSLLKMAQPNYAILEAFSKKMAAIVAMELEIEEQNDNLTKQRDELLPLLMNGQASVNSD